MIYSRKLTHSDNPTSTFETPQAQLVSDTLDSLLDEKRYFEHVFTRRATRLTLLGETLINLLKLTLH